MTIDQPLPPVGLPTGIAAPPLVLPRWENIAVDLASFKGRRHVVVSFMALVFTGSTDWGVEGTVRAFERIMPELRELDATVLTVTADSVFCNDAFTRFVGGLSFPILSDFLPRGAVSRAWNCWAPEREHPRNVTFVVGIDGVIRYCEHHKKAGMPDMDEVLTAVEECVMLEQDADDEVWAEISAEERAKG